MSEQTATTDETLSYEEAFSRLEALIAGLEAGDLPLEEALARYEEGVQLTELCERLLEDAELRVRQWQPEDDAALQLEWQEE